MKKLELLKEVKTKTTKKYRNTNQQLAKPCDEINIQIIANANQKEETNSKQETIQMSKSNPSPSWGDE